MNQTANRPGPFGAFFGIGELSVVIGGDEIAPLHTNRQKVLGSFFQFNCALSVQPHLHEIV